MERGREVDRDKGSGLTYLVDSYYTLSNWSTVKWVLQLAVTGELSLWNVFI